MRRLYQRRADTMVLATVGAICIGVLVMYFEMQDPEAAPSEAAPDETPRLVILPTMARSDIVLGPDVLAGMPQLEAALDAAQRAGSATVEDTATIDAIWFQLVEAYGIDPRLPVVLEHEGARYSLQMID